MVQLQKWYRKRLASTSNIIFAFFIILIPIFNSSPLSMLPLAGYVLILFLDYLFVAGKLNKVAANPNGQGESSKNKKAPKKNGEFGDLLDAPVDEEDELNQLNSEEENKKAEDSSASEDSSEDIQQEKDSYYTRLIWIPQLLLISSSLLLSLLKIQSFSVYTPGIKSIYKNLVFLTTKSQNDFSSNIFIFCALASLLFLQYFKECKALRSIKHLLPQSRGALKTAAVLQNKEDHAEDKHNMFNTFFKKKFTSILDINMSEQVDDFGNLKHDFIRDFEGIVNLEKFRKQCIAARKQSQTGFAKAKAKMSRLALRVGKYLLEKTKMVLLGVLDFFTNPVLLLFFETILASFFVVFVDPSVFILPVMVWIFLNYILPLSSTKAIKIKLLLLVIPLIIVCTKYKIDYHVEWNTTSNPDFNFVKADQKSLVESIIGVFIVAVVIIELTAQKVLDQGLYKKQVVSSEAGSHLRRGLK